MVKDLIDMDYITIIDRINIKPDIQQPIKMINNNLFETKPFNKEQFPLLKGVKGYNHKVFLESVLLNL